MNYFLNFENGRIVSSTYRNNGDACGNELEFIESVVNEKSATITVDDHSAFIKACAVVLNDVAFLEKYNRTEEQIKNARNIFINFEDY